jgi:hypothetical protein
MAHSEDRGLLFAVTWATEPWGTTLLLEIPHLQATTNHPQAHHLATTTVITPTLYGTTRPQPM